MIKSVAVKRTYFVRLLIVNASIMWLAFSPGLARGDYGAFYAAGLASPNSIYSLHPGYQPFYRPIQEAMLFRPLAFLPFELSFWVWRALSVLMLWIAARMLRLDLVQYLSFVPILACLIFGQDSIMVLLLLTIAFRLMENDKDIWAGAVLALAMVKPQIPFMVAVALLMCGRRKLFVSFCVSGTVILSATFAIYRNWIPHFIAAVRLAEPNEIPTHMISWHGLVAVLFGDTGLSFALSAITVAAASFYWSHSDARKAFATAIVVGSLVAYHIHSVDVSMFLITIAVLPSVSKWLYVYYVSPLLIALGVFSLGGLLAVCSVGILAQVFSPEIIALRIRGVSESSAQR